MPATVPELLGGLPGDHPSAAAPAPRSALAGHTAAARHLILVAPRTYWVTETAATLEIAGPASIECQRRLWSLANHWRSCAGVREVVPAMNNLTVVLEPDAPRLEELLDDLHVGWEQSDAASVTPRQIEIPVQYGGTAGVDLEQVAQHTGLPADQIIRLHAGAEYTVYFLGFVPGFAYLGGLDARLATPRRAQPRLSVPAGSVAIGGTHTGVYPSTCPGGWQLIGRTSLSLFDPARDPPSLLLPGDTVRFVDLGAGA